MRGARLYPQLELHLPPGVRPQPFAALRHRNFRLFFVGQFISLVGTWMQRVAQAWLVLQITNSPFLLGVVGALQWLPVLFLSLIGGAVADRVSKRNLLVVTQTAQMLQAFALGVLVFHGAVQYWHIVVLACALGFTSAFDIPTRQAFIFEMVEGADTMNAIALNSTIFNGARLFGPAIAGVAIGTIGMAWAFIANGVSFLFVIGALLMMRPSRRFIVDVGTGLLTHLHEGVAYLFGTPVVLQIIALVAAQSIFVMNFQIFVPVFAKDVLHQEAAGFGFLMSAQGTGALVGALVVASLSCLGPRPGFVFGGSVLLSLAALALAAASGFAAAAVLLALAGASLVMFTATSNTTLQLTAPDHLRGRVMSTYAIVMGGMTPIGSLVAGGLAQVWGARGALLVCGAAGLIASIAVLQWRRRTGWAVPDSGAAPVQASSLTGGGGIAPLPAPAAGDEGGER